LPSCNNRSQRCEPRNPAPPVINIRFIILFYRFRGYLFLLFVLNLKYGRYVNHKIYDIAGRNIFFHSFASHIVLELFLAL